MQEGPRRDLEQARSAFEENDVEKSRLAHLAHEIGCFQRML
jgi:hypothetical protein